MATPKQTDPQFKLRLPAELKKAIEAAAAASNRTMNAEIIERLEYTFSEEWKLDVTNDVLAKANDLLAQLKEDDRRHFDELEEMRKTYAAEAAQRLSESERQLKEIQALRERYEEALAKVDAKSLP